MNEDLDSLQYAPFYDFEYERLFQKVQFNGKTLSPSEKKELITTIDETIASYTSGLPMLSEGLKWNEPIQSKITDIERTFFLFPC